MLVGRETTFNKFRQNDIQSGVWHNKINACQVVLAKQFTTAAGLQDVSHGIFMDFAIETQPFVQILHNSDKNEPLGDDQ